MTPNILIDVYTTPCYICKNSSFYPDKFVCVYYNTTEHYDGNYPGKYLSEEERLTSLKVFNYTYCDNLEPDTTSTGGMLYNINFHYMLKRGNLI